MSDPARPLPQGLPLANRGGREPPVDVGDGRIATVLSKDEVRAILRAVDGPFAARDRALIEVAYFFALRCSEACDLDLADIDWPRARLRIRQRKTRREKEGTMAPRVVAALRAYTGLHRSADAGPLFVSRRGGRLTTNAVWRNVRRYAEWAGIPSEKAKSHVVFRASRLTHLVEDGVPLRAVQAWADHRSYRSTACYVRAAQGWEDGYALSSGL